MTAVVRPDRRLRHVLIVAAAMSSGYGLEMVVDLLRPRIAADPAISAASSLSPFSAHADPGVRVTFGLVLLSWLVALVAVVIAVPGSARVRRAVLIVTTVALLLPFAFVPVVSLLLHAPLALICVPSTAFALWLVRRMQRYRRIPAWLLLAAAGWGIFVAAGFGGALNDWSFDYVSAYFYDAGDLFRSWRDANTGTFLNAAVVEELGKAAGVAAIYLLLRRYVDDVVAGLVLGSAVGLGFNFTETVLYMANHGAGNAAFQYWMRQSVGLMAAHTVFTAVVGASIGAARQLPHPRTRRLVVACGLLAAIGGHFASDVILKWFTVATPPFLASGTAFDTLAVQPLLLFTLQAPYLVVVYVLLLRVGQRAQAAAITVELRAEAAERRGTITDAEVPVLADPAGRFRQQFRVLRRYGLAAYRALGRVHAAQYDLATQRWHRARHDPDEHPPSEHHLRDLVLRRKRELASATSPYPARPQRVPP